MTSQQQKRTFIHQPKPKRPLKTYDDFFFSSDIVAWQRGPSLKYRKSDKA